MALSLAPTAAASERRASLVLVAIFGVVYAIVSRVAFHGFPFSGDEYSTCLQAQIFSKGALATHAPPHPSLLYVDHVVIDDRVRSKYPPGCAALLALGLLAGAPWVVNPIAAVVTLAFLRKSARLVFGDRAALVTVVVAGVSPLFVFNAASFYAHAAATMWLAIAFAALAHFSRHERRSRLVVAGVALGAALLTRPHDAVLFAVPILALGRCSAVAWTAGASLPGVALLLLYQKLQFGGWFTSGYRAYAPIWQAVYGNTDPSLGMGIAMDPDEQWHHLDILRGFCLDWTLPGSIVLFALGAAVVWRGAPASRRFYAFALGVFALPPLALIATHALPDDGPLPRYLSTSLIPMAFFAGPGWIAVEAQLSTLVGAARSRGIAALMVGLGITSFVCIIGFRMPLLWDREGLYRAAVERGLHDAVVIVRSRHATQYTRNGPTLDGSVLYVRPDIADPAAILSWFPGRTIYEATEARPWTLRALSPPP
jgi:hypothetical protein